MVLCSTKFFAVCTLVIMLMTTSSHNADKEESYQDNESTLAGSELDSKFDEILEKVDELSVNRNELIEKIDKLEIKVEQMDEKLTDTMLNRMQWQFGWLAGIVMGTIAVIGIINSLVMLLIIRSLREKMKNESSLYTKELERLKFKYVNAVDAAKEGALSILQASSIVLDAVENVLERTKAEEISVQMKELILRRTETTRSRLEVTLGKSEEVITGANMLSELGTPNMDVKILREALKREGLSKEAYKTLERAIEDLEEKRIEGRAK